MFFIFIFLFLSLTSLTKADNELIKKIEQTIEKIKETEEKIEQIEIYINKIMQKEQNQNQLQSVNPKKNEAKTQTEIKAIQDEARKKGIRVKTEEEKKQEEAIKKEAEAIINEAEKKEISNTEKYQDIIKKQKTSLEDRIKARKEKTKSVNKEKIKTT